MNNIILAFVCGAIGGYVYKFIYKHFGDKRGVKTTDIQQKPTIDNAEDSHNEFRIVKAKTAGGETKYFVEFVSLGKWATLESTATNKLSEAIRDRDYLIKDKIRKKQNKIIDKEVIE